jgi:hypothetical protein
VTINRSTLNSDLGLAAAIAGGMLGTFLVMFLIVRFALHRPLGLSALTALAVGAPAVPFAGVVVLGYLYGPSLSAVPVAVGALAFNVVEVPVTLVLLSAAVGQRPRHQSPHRSHSSRGFTRCHEPAFASGAGQTAPRCRRRRHPPAADPPRTAPPPPPGPGAARPAARHRRVGAGLALVLVLASTSAPESTR